MTGFSNRGEAHDDGCSTRRPMIQKKQLWLDKYRQVLIMTHSHWTLLITNYLSDWQDFQTERSAMITIATRRPLIRRTLIADRSTDYRQVLMWHTHTGTLCSRDYHRLSTTWQDPKTEGEAPLSGLLGDHWSNTTLDRSTDKVPTSIDNDTSH
jgi:hypothetical protein